MFTWDRIRKEWYTADPLVVSRLLPYCDPLAKAILNPQIAQIETNFYNSRSDSTEKVYPAPKGLSYLPFQNAGIEGMLELKSLILGDEMGCIDGDAVIQVMRCGRSRKIALKDLYQKINYKWTKDHPTYARALCNGELRQHKIEKVLLKGEKDTIRITTQSGKTITLTPDHEVAQPSNVWTEAGKLKVGDVVLTNGVPLCIGCGSDQDVCTYSYAKYKGYCKTCIYRTKRNNNIKEGKFLDGDGYWRVTGQYDHPRRNTSYQVYEHVLIMEAHIGRYVDYPREHVHHINEDRSDNRLENLKLVTPSEHHVIHSKHQNLHGSRSSNGGQVVFVPREDPIVSIEPAGVREVYDIVMEDPHRNFVANGVVVHNCGKSIQIAGLINEVKPKKVLLVCPSFLKLNWRKELSKWLLPELNLTIGIAKQKKWPDANIVIINYEQLWRHKEYIYDTPWDIIVGDEAHYIKNSKAKRTKSFIKLKAPRRILLTGTPLKNTVDDVWQLANWVKPESWPSLYMFRRMFLALDKKTPINLEELNLKLRGTCMIRRLKSEVLSELPSKTRQVIELPNDGIKKSIEAEVEAYKKAKDIEAQISFIASSHLDYQEKLRELSSAKIEAINEWKAARKVVGLAKVDQVVEHVKNILVEQDKVVLFCHHHEVIAAYCEAFKDICELHYGELTNDEREYSVNRFQNDPTCRVLIAGISTAVGYTATKASTAVFAELSWIPADLNQAEDRIFRIGQINPVLIQHLVLEGSVDFRLVERVIEKQLITNKAIDSK